jgi:hypothetical protein
MYAITHASTALILKKRFPEAAIWPLLISVQAIELLWVIFVYAGIEHVVYTRDSVHLAFLPYSHSIGTGLLVGAASWAAIRLVSGKSQLALAVALGVVSHVALDLIHHERDIALLPLASSPRFGLGVVTHPAADLAVEIIYGIVCWYLFTGTKGLLAAIVIFNLLNIPTMFPRPGTGAMMAQHPAILPTVILVEIIATWIAIWFFARRR